jgi:hypothetical protein
MDRRAVFFLLAAWACRELTFHTPTNLRYVGNIMVVWLLVLATLSWLDHKGRRKPRPRV